MFKHYKFLLNCSSIFLVILFCSLPLRAINTVDTVDNLKNQFVALGGSVEGFNQILSVVQKAQDDSTKLKEKITQTYNKQMFDIMVASNFDSKAYTQVYNSLNLDKSQLVTQNVNAMINLLNGLSLKDRQAYAQLLYGSGNAKRNSNISNTPDAVPNKESSVK